MLSALRMYNRSMMGKSSFQERRLSRYPIGLIVRVRMVSGRELEARIAKIETTELGTFLHVEFDEEVANIAARQILGFYDFCFIKTAHPKTYAASR
jgi:hypothetical protein